MMKACISLKDSINNMYELELFFKHNGDLSISDDSKLLTIKEKDDKIVILPMKNILMIEIEDVEYTNDVVDDKDDSLKDKINIHIKKDSRRHTLVVSDSYDDYVRFLEESGIKGSYQIWNNYEDKTVALKFEHGGAVIRIANKRYLLENPNSLSNHVFSEAWYFDGKNIRDLDEM